MIEKVYKYIKENNMLEGCTQIVIGISGGADSVCLLTVMVKIIKMHKLPITLKGIHVNHGIRGEEAYRDEKFAKKLCETLGVAYQSVSIDIPAMAREQKLSEEEAGRIARYEIFRKTAVSLQDKENSSNKVRIAVAHHRNDQAETVLMNMFRGSSLKGICGMQPVRGDIIRPLLCATRQEIEAYLKQIGQDYITDSTNFDNNYTRNKLRNQLIPYIQQNLNVNAVDHIAELSESISEAESFISRQADSLFNKCVKCSIEPIEDRADSNQVSIFVQEIKDADKVLQTYVIRKAIHMMAGKLKDVYKSHIESVLSLINQQVGKKVNIAYGITAVRKYDKIILMMSANARDGNLKRSILKQNEISADMQIKDTDYLIEVDKKRLENLNLGEMYSVDVNKNVYFPDKGLVYVDKILFEKVARLEKMVNNMYTIYFNYKKIDSQLFIRGRRIGDYLTVNANGSSKKLKKELIDRKIPAEYRDNVMLLTQERKVLWICGIRRSESALAEADTDEIIMVKIQIKQQIKPEHI